MESIMRVRDPKNPPEIIVDKTPKQPFLSPLQQFIALNCERCTNYKGLCRLNDSRGLTPMALCIRLYCNQPPDLSTVLASMSEKTQKIAESTLKDLKLGDEVVVLEDAEADNT